MTANDKVLLQELPNADVEIRYFDDDQSGRYRSWKMTEAVARELTAWWRDSRNKNNKQFPLRGKTELCEVLMVSEKQVDIHALDRLGRRTMMSWSLPSDVVEKLAEEYVCNGKTMGQDS